MINVGTLKISQHHRVFWGGFLLVLVLHFGVPSAEQHSKIKSSLCHGEM